jgi:glycolate oxidase
MSLLMPLPEPQILDKRDDIVARLQAIVRPGNVIHLPRELSAYECDALTMYRQPPLVVVLPETVAEVSAVMKLADEKIGRAHV